MELKTQSTGGRTPLAEVLERLKTQAESHAAQTAALEAEHASQIKALEAQVVRIQRSRSPGGTGRGP